MEKTVTIETRKCEKCDGTGHIVSDTSENIVCENCDGKGEYDIKIKFKSTANMATKYQAQFRRGFFKDFNKMVPSKKVKQQLQSGNVTPDDLDDIDLNIAFQMAWTMAKLADKNTPDPDTFLDQFGLFDMVFILPEIFELLLGNIDAEKKTLEMKKFVSQKR